MKQKFINKKNIAILVDPNSEISFLICKILVKSKYFNPKIIIFRNKNLQKIRKFKKIFSKNITYFVSSFPHRANKIRINAKENKINLCFNSSWHNRLRPSFLKIFKSGVINFHPSPLPLNRGLHSAFYGIMNNTIHGSTMHVMDEKFDQGKVIDTVIYKNKDNYFANYVTKRSHNLSLQILRKNLKLIYSKDLKKLKKIPKKHLKKFKYHKKKDIKKFDTLKVDDKIKVEKLWRLIKATKFKQNGYFIKSKSGTYLIQSIIKKIK